MTLHRFDRIAWLLPVLLGVTVSHPARAESTSCTVVSIFPASLSVPGRYCLAQNVTLSATGGAVIYVTADDVDLDCNDHVVRNTAPAGNGASGLQTSGSRRGLRVRNCTFDGFETGISVDSGATAGGNRLQNNRIVRAGSYGMFLSGNGLLVEGNHVSTQRGGASIYPTGIYLSGQPGRATGNVLRGNTIVDMAPVMPSNAGSAGMHVNYQQGLVIEDNTVTTIRSRTGAGSYGIISSYATGLVVRGNTILSPVAPGTAPFDGGNYSGIFLQGTDLEDATNQCIDNVVGHFNGNITGCVQVETLGL
jgi:hypothetical protein